MMFMFGKEFIFDYHLSDILAGKKIFATHLHYPLIHTILTLGWVWWQLIITSPNLIFPTPLLQLKKNLNPNSNPIKVYFSN